MVKKSRLKKNKDRTDSKSLQSKRTSTVFSEFISGPNIKWLFFAVYLFVTIFLFRDFLFSDGMLYGSDTIPDGIYTRQYYKDYHDEFGGIPKWNPFILGGLPFIDAMHGDTFYPAAWLKFFIPLTRALGYKLIWHVFLAGIFMYIFLRILKLRNEAAFLGGLMYMLAPSFVSWIYGGHDAKMYVITLLPLAAAFLEMGMNNPRFYRFVCLGAVMGLLILTSHVQMAYYSYWAIGLFFLYRLFTSGDIGSKGITKRVVFFIIAVIIALTLGAVQLLPSYKYTTSQSVRTGEERSDYEYATSFSMHFEEAVGMIVSSFPGINFTDGRIDREGVTYWGKNPFKLNTEYHGIVPIIFALMALIFLCSRSKWFFLGIAMLSLIYSLGAETPVYKLFYTLVPGVKNFRAPSMMIFIFFFAFVVLASKFISSLLDEKTSLRKEDRRLLYAVGVVLVIAVVVSVMGPNFFELWNSIFYRAMPDNKANAMIANVPYFTRDLWRVVILISVSIMGVWMFLSRKIGELAFIILIALVIFIDDSYVDKKFITVIDPKTYNGTVPDQTVWEIQSKITESRMPFRVLGLFSGKSANYYAMFRIQAADGMHNNELQSYELFKGGGYSQNFTSFWVERNNFVPEGLAKNNFLKVSGVKYLILPTSQGWTQLFENEYALDRAFIVHGCVAVDSDTAAVEMLKDSSFDPSQEVIITGKVAQPNADKESASESVVKSFAYTENGMNISADFRAHGFLVLAENYVPYWKAEVDGEPAVIHKAFGTFMAVECSEGNHQINFTFWSSPYNNGKKLTLSSLVFIIVSFAVSGISEIVRKKKKTL